MPITATGHNWGEPVWNWAEDFVSAEAPFTCSSCEEQETVEVEIAITVMTQPTCTEAVQTIYTASVTFGGETCTDTQTVPEQALGHDLVRHEAKAATCTEIGWEAYDTCSRCDYSTYVEIPALGHNWEEPTYSWSDSNATVTAIRICANNADHTEKETVNTTFVTTPAAAGIDGSVIYTAEFTNPAFETQIKMRGRRIRRLLRYCGADSSIIAQ